MGTSITGINQQLNKLTHLFPNHRPPQVLASKAELTELRPKDHRAPATPTGSIPATGADLNLMTYNVWGLQWPIGQRQEERMNQIGPAVKGHDVVALQESFTRHTAAVGRLGQYDYKLTGSDGGLFRGKSGLTMLTSQAIVAKDFVPFEKAASADRLSQKGVLFMRLQVPGTGPVDVYSTHFQAGGGPEFTAQNVETLVKMVKDRDQGYPTFIMGDFNMTPDEAEYQSLVKQLDLRDVYAEQHPGEVGATASPSNTNHEPTDKPERIDYIFARRNDRYDVAITSAEIGMTQTFNGKHPSDHFAVIGQFHITPKGHAPVSSALAAVRAVAGAGVASR